MGGEGRNDCTGFPGLLFDSPSCCCSEVQSDASSCRIVRGSAAHSLAPTPLSLSLTPPQLPPSVPQGTALVLRESMVKVLPDEDHRWLGGLRRKRKAGEMAEEPPAREAAAVQWAGGGGAGASGGVAGGSSSSGSSRYSNSASVIGSGTSSEASQGSDDEPVFINSLEVNETR